MSGKPGRQTGPGPTSADGSSGRAGAHRRARIAELRAQEQRLRRRNQRIVFALVTAVVLGAGGAGAYAVKRSSDEHKARAAAAQAPIQGVKTFGAFTRNHVTTPVKYTQTPPVGGDHDPVWVPCMGNVYDQPVHNENAVHSLEHGAVWVTYNSKATAADIASLAERVEVTPYTFLSPYPDEPGTITLSAWSTQLIVDSATDPRIGEFLTKYIQGPQTQEPGASCSPGAM
ncbi:DUF3105 domain-containing protein [Kitasatospora sp. NBC_00070]|uniref:DUF3105 domain-containing protein n=1 Tax=Kitasatospora sp. NBC_00070 TaxID=2975962 RepID=UPI0032526FD5